MVAARAYAKRGEAAIESSDARSDASDEAHVRAQTESAITHIKPVQTHFCMVFFLAASIG